MSASIWATWRWPVCFGNVAGAMIAAVDNILFEGEVSPIVIVGMLLAATVTSGAVWGRQGWVATVVVWVWVPAAHVVKRVLGLPDTLHPNTYGSILMLAAFSLAVAAFGTGVGLLARRLASHGPRQAEPGATAGGGA